jgi:hypothetical protein
LNVAVIIDVYAADSEAASMTVKAGPRRAQRNVDDYCCKCRGCNRSAFRPEAIATKISAANAT